MYEMKKKKMMIRMITVSSVGWWRACAYIYIYVWEGEWWEEWIGERM